MPNYTLFPDGHLHIVDFGTMSATSAISAPERATEAQNEESLRLRGGIPEPLYKEIFQSGFESGYKKALSELK